MPQPGRQSPRGDASRPCPELERPSSSQHPVDCLLRRQKDNIAPLWHGVTRIFHPVSDDRLKTAGVSPDRRQRFMLIEKRDVLDLCLRRKSHKASTDSTAAESKTSASSELEWFGGGFWDKKGLAWPANPLLFFSFRRPGIRTPDFHRARTAPSMCSACCCFISARKHYLLDGVPHCYGRWSIICRRQDSSRMTTP